MHQNMSRLASRYAAILILSLSAAAHVQAQPATPLTLEQVMADPEWIVPGVEQAWWC